MFNSLMNNSDRMKNNLGQFREWNTADTGPGAPRMGASLVSDSFVGVIIGLSHFTRILGSLSIYLGLGERLCEDL